MSPSGDASRDDSTSMDQTMSQHAQEVAIGQRFKFGKNWERFLSVLDDARIAAAEESLHKMLEVDRLDGKRFLDVGCGSGLFSLAAARLGAKVHSFDYDPQSVACTRYLKERYAPNADWVAEEGSVLDPDYLDRLGEFDVAYAWGVLHHTGSMWQALGNVAPLVRKGGKLFVAIYNDQGGASRRWGRIKRRYNIAPWVMKPFIFFPVMLYCEGRVILGRIVRGRNPFEAWMGTGTQRGMSKWHDWIDWIGGYPFEVAKPEEIFEFLRARGFCLTKMRTQAGSLGCNEFVLIKGSNACTTGGRGSRVAARSVARSCHVGSAG